MEIKLFRDYHKRNVTLQILLKMRVWEVEWENENKGRKERESGESEKEERWEYKR